MLRAFCARLPMAIPARSQRGTLHWLTGASLLNRWCGVRKLQWLPPKTFTKANIGDLISDLLAKGQACPISSECGPWSMSIARHTPQSVERVVIVLAPENWARPIRFKTLNLLFSNALLSARSLIASWPCNFCGCPWRMLWLLHAFRANNSLYARSPDPLFPCDWGVWCARLSIGGFVQSCEGILMRCKWYSRIFKALVSHTPWWEWMY